MPEDDVHLENAFDEDTKIINHSQSVLISTTDLGGSRTLVLSGRNKNNDLETFSSRLLGRSIVVHVWHKVVSSFSSPPEMKKLFFYAITALQRYIMLQADYHGNTLFSS